MLIEDGQDSIADGKIARWAYDNRKVLEPLMMRMSANANFFNCLPESRMTALGYAKAHNNIQALIGLGGEINNREKNQ